MPKATLWCGFWRPAGTLDTFQSPWIPLEICGVLTNLLNEQVGLSNACNKTDFERDL